MQCQELLLLTAAEPEIRVGTSSLPCSVDIGIFLSEPSGYFGRKRRDIKPADINACLLIGVDVDLGGDKLCINTIDFQWDKPFLKLSRPSDRIGNIEPALTYSVTNRPLPPIEKVLLNVIDKLLSTHSRKQYSSHWSSSNNYRGN